MKIGLFTGLSALALVATAGGLYQAQAVAGARSSEAEAATARKYGDQARKAIAKRDAAAAIHYAELAVELSPRDGGYRALLGQAYLLSGRFGSARTALLDSLSLTPGDGKVALNLALAQIADGDWTAARSTLDVNANTIPIADRGLAMALAGDPAGAVELMLPVARAPGSEPKLRQNLALSLALAGRWQDARLVASLDLSPADVDKRVTEWAVFARPTGKSDQVAALLGVAPAADPGQPVALALNGVAAPAGINAYVPAEPAPVSAQASVQVAPAPEAPAVAAPPVAVAATVPGEVAAAPAAFVRDAAPKVVFGPRREVVQALPAVTATGTRAPLIKAKGAYVKSVAAIPPTPGASTASVGKGVYYVQLGAYDSAGVARDGWARASRAYSGFAGHQPQGMAFTHGGKTFYRLSIGGFDRAGAVRLCRTYRAKGGKCFVRIGAGDEIAAWVKDVKVAQKTAGRVNKG